MMINYLFLWSTTRCSETEASQILENYPCEWRIHIATESALIVIHVTEVLIYSTYFKSRSCYYINLFAMFLFISVLPIFIHLRVYHTSVSTQLVRIWFRVQSDYVYSLYNKIHAMYTQLEKCQPVVNESLSAHGVRVSHHAAVCYTSPLSTQTLL